MTKTSKKQKELRWFSHLSHDLSSVSERAALFEFFRTNLKTEFYKQHCHFFKCFPRSILISFVMKTFEKGAAVSNQQFIGRVQSLKVTLRYEGCVRAVCFLSIFVQRVVKRVFSKTSSSFKPSGQEICCPLQALFKAYVTFVVVMYFCNWRTKR